MCLCLCLCKIFLKLYSKDTLQRPQTSWEPAEPVKILCVPTNLCKVHTSTNV